MATSSMFRNVSIRNKHLAKSMLRFLEKAQAKKYKEHTLTKSCREAKGEEIKDVLKDFKK